MSRSLAFGLAFVVVVLGIAWLTGFERDAETGPVDLAPHAAIASAPAGVVPTPVELAESSSDEAPTSRTPETLLRRLRVVAADDEPSVATRVVFFDAERVESIGETDATGWLAVPADVAAHSVALAPRSAPPHAVRIEWQDRATTIVRLPAGLRVAGDVSVDGARPSVPLTLSLYGNADRQPAGDFEALAPDVWAALEIDLERSLRLKASTDARGAFAFHGLRADWDGGLVAPVDFVLQPELVFPAGVVARVGRLELSEPCEGLVLRLRSKITVRGRIVSSDGTAGVARARVRFTVLSEHGRGGPSTNANENGHFSIAVNPFATAAPRIEIGREDGSASRDLELGAFPSGVAEWKLGDLPVAPTQDLELLVLDADGVPIDDARVREWDGEPRDAEPGFYALLATTDGNGRCSFSCERGFAVSAPRHGRRDIRIPAVVPDVLEVVLQAACALEVRVSAEGEGDASGVEVSIETRAPLFAEGDAWLPSYDRSLDLRSDGYGLDRSGEGGRFQYAPPADGAGLLSGLRPRVPLVLQLVDANGFLVLEQREPGLFPGEQRVVELTVTDAPRRFSGQVVDADGAPVEGASVYVTGTSGFWSSTVSTGADGGFEMTGYFREATKLTVRDDRLGLMHVQREWLPPEDGGFARIELPRVRTVRAQVLADGRTVESGTFAYALDGERVTKRARFRSGRREIRGIPDAVNTLLLAYGGTEYAQPIGSGESEVRFEVPAAGSVVVDFSSERGPTENDNWTLRLGLDGAGSAALRSGVRAPGSGVPHTYTFDEAVPGTHALLLEGLSFDTGDSISVGPVEVIVRAGETTSVSFDVDQFRAANGD